MRVGSETIFDSERSGLEKPWGKGSGEMQVVEHRRVNRFLEVQAIVEVTQQQQQRPLVLLVAAGRAADEVGCAVAFH